MMTDMVAQPVEIKKEIDHLRVAWSDGHVGNYPYHYLRVNCRCAACVEEWTGTVLVKSDQVPESVAPVLIKAVGRYAISIEWNDGHASGIYAYPLLRSLCPCTECREAKPGQAGASKHGAVS